MKYVIFLMRYSVKITHNIKFGAEWGLPEKSPIAVMSSNMGNGPLEILIENKNYKTAFLLHKYRCVGGEVT